MDDFADALLMVKAGHPELAGWWGKLLSGGAVDDGVDKPFDALTWEQIIASTKTGKYKTFAIGQTCAMDLDDFGTVHMQIAGIDADELADGSGHAPLSLIVQECFGNVISGNNTYWPESYYYNYLNNVIWPKLPKIVRDNCKTVAKYTNTYRNGTLVQNFESAEKIWAPSFHEVRTDVSTIETLGVTYDKLFTGEESRQKIILNDSITSSWMLRSASSESIMRVVKGTGVTGLAPRSDSPIHAVFGFCL